MLIPMRGALRIVMLAMAFLPPSESAIAQKAPPQLVLGAGLGSRGYDDALYGPQGYLLAGVRVPVSRPLSITVDFEGWADPGPCPSERIGDPTPPRCHPGGALASLGLELSGREARRSIQPFAGTNVGIAFDDGRHISAGVRVGIRVRLSSRMSLRPEVRYWHSVGETKMQSIVGAIGVGYLFKSPPP